MPSDTDLMPRGLTAGTTPQSQLDLHGPTDADVYAYWESVHPDLREALWAYETGEAERLATATGGWQEGIDTLVGGQDRILNDPNMQAVFASLDEMMSPDYNAIGEAELAGLQGQLASGINRAQSSRAAAMRRAGLSGSGMDIGNAPLFTAIGASGLANVNASVDIANQQARDRATTQRGQFGMQQQGMLAPLDFGIAGLQADPPTSGFDPLLGLSLDWEMDRADIEDVRYEEEVARQEEAMQAFEDSQPFAWAPEPFQGILNAGTDFFNFLSPFQGTGIPRTVLP